MMVPINYWAVLGGAVILIVLGFIWYGPLFGKKWAHLSGVSMDAMKKPRAGTIILLIIGSLIMSFVLDHALIFANYFLGTSGAASGIMVGLLNWIGFIAPVTMGSVLWEKKSWKLWWINNGYYIVGLCLAGMLLATWM